MAFKGKRSGSQDSDLSLSDEEWDEKARGILLGRLTRGPRTKHQLARLLSDRGVPEQIALQLLDRFQEVGLIDDAMYARAFAHDRRESRGLSKGALKRELSQAGVAQDDFQEVLDEITSEEDFELALKLVRKRWSSLEKLEPDARFRRLAGYLGRRGFSGGIVSSAIQQVSREG